MGAIISKWRKQPSTIELLEKLEKEIEALEKVKRTNLESQKRVIGKLVLYSVLLYICAALLFYFFYLPAASSWPQRLLYSTPLLLFPPLVWLLKRFLHWYFIKRISKNESALEDLRDQKKTILEEVMEKETYKKAKEILEKFDPDRFKALETPAGVKAPQKAPDGQEIRQRHLGIQGSPQPGTSNKSINSPAGARLGAPGPSQPTPSPAPPGGRRQLNGKPIPAGTPMPPPPGPPMPRPILPRERSTAERVIELLVGDGPQNSYALICTQCNSHNGMAYKEEFDYLSFRCCYCYHFNPARKQRPSAPKLPASPATTPRRPPPQAHGGENDANKSSIDPTSALQGQGHEKGRDETHAGSDTESNSEKSEPSEETNRN